jgi:hypothetical protein
MKNVSIQNILRQDISLTSIVLALHRATLVTNVVTHENKSDVSIVAVMTINRIAIVLMSVQ